MLKKVFRNLSVALVVLMLFSFVACTNKSNEQQEQRDTTAQSQQSTENSTTQDSQAAPEPITLTFYGMNQGFTTGVQSDEVSKEIQRLTGVTLECIAASSNQEEQLMAMMASRDLPDLLQVWGQQYFPQLIDGDNIYQLDELVEKYGKDIVANGPKRLINARNGFNGKLYYINGKSGEAVPPSQVATAHYIRWDYYKELGSPEFATTLDLIPILKEMQEKHPTNKDGKKVYALSPFFDWGPYNFTVLSQMYGVDTFASVCDIDMWTGEIKSWSDDSSYIWKAIQFYNKGYQAGILDPDCVTQTNANFNEKAGTSRTLHGWWPGVLREANAALSSEGELVGFMGVLPKDATRPVLGEASKVFGGPARLFCIPKNSKSPERAMQYLNFLNTYDAAEIIYNGIKGKHWDLGNDGKPYLFDSTIAAKQTDADFYSATGINQKWTEMAGLWIGVTDPRYGTIVDLWESAGTLSKLLNPLQKDYSAHFKISTPGEYSYAPKADERDVIAQSVSTLGVMPDDLQKKKNDVLEAIMTDGVKMMFSKTDAEFAEKKAVLQAKLKALGNDDVTEWVKGAFEAAKTNYLNMK